MLRRTMQIGDELHICDKIIILEKITPGKTLVAIIDKTAPFVLRRTANGSAVTTIEQRDEPAVPYHPEINEMLKA